MRFEEILDENGVFGLYQKRIYALICILFFCSAMITLSHVFVAGESDYWSSAPELHDVNCSLLSLNSEQCVNAKKMVSIPLSTADNSAYEYENCMRYNLTEIEPTRWYPDWVTSDVTNDTTRCNAGWIFDTSQFNTTIITDFGLICNKRNHPNLAQSMYFVGILIGSLALGSISDWIGRCPTLTVALVVGVACIFLSALSNSYIMFIVLRACIGATIFSAECVGFTLISEFVNPSWRTFVGNLTNFSWVAGHMFVGGLGYFIRKWRILLFAVSEISFLMLFLLPFLLESPRWLISKGRTTDAAKVIRKVAKVNKKELPGDFLNNLELQEQNLMNQENKPLVQNFVLDLLRHSSLRHKTLVLMFIWLITNLEYYGFAQMTGDLGVNFYVSFFISEAVEIPACIYVVFALDWVGRKPNLSGSLFSGGIACLLSVLIPVGVWKMTVSMIGKFFIAIIFAILPIFTVEQFPTPVRNVALGLFIAFGRLGNILFPIIFIIKDYWTHLPFVIFGAMSLAGGLMALLLPETKGKNLPETFEEVEQV